MSSIGAYILVAWLAVAIPIDLRTHRIPNGLCLGILMTGAAVQFASMGVFGVWFALGGVAAGAMLFLPLYTLGGMGAGDVKLIAASGSFLGPFGVLIAAGLALVAGGAMAMGVMGFRAAAATRSGTPISAALHAARGTRFPFAAAIAIGTCAWIFGVSELGALT
jgi:prepilin peptidase CpaA